MKNIFAFIFLFCAVHFVTASLPDLPEIETQNISTLQGSDSLTANDHASVLVIPYMPSMHLSDADPDISEGSDMEMPLMRETLRKGIVNAINKNFAEVYDIRGVNNEFVMGDNLDLNVLYHAVYFSSDSVYPLKNPKQFAVKDTTAKKKGVAKPKAETSYINVGIYDSELLTDLSKKYDADYIIFLNEIDIKTHSEDCINLALKIYRRDIKIHYSIFDRHGKQLYGDVAVSNFASNANDVNEIMKENFPGIADYILASFNRATK